MVTAPARVLLAALLLGCGTKRPVLTARDLLAAPGRYDGVPIVLVGQVRELRVRTPVEGNPYTAFVLADGTGRVPVFAWGTLPIGSGDLVEVRGTFRPTQHAGSDVLRHAVEADFVRPLRAAPQPPGTPVGPP